MPYFARLGISHLYASPIATARPGSQHGYDVIDATPRQSRAGRRGGLARAVVGARRGGLGLILDIVPNHMAADAANAWWADVLRHGRASRFARCFDIDWEADDKVLLPILGRPLDEVLAAGELERDGDAFRYFSHRLPAVDGGLESQHWRLAWWRSAGDRINWRRFFDINELVCLRMEEPEAFEAVHALPLRLHAEGIVDGLRIDHVDGLGDPAAYCRTLARARSRPGALPRGREDPAAPARRLPADWGCDGTTGYDFMDEVNALQHDPAGERVLAEAWSALSGRPADFAAEEEAARREILARSFGAQLDACAAAFAGGELGTAAAAPRAGRAAGAFPGLSHLRPRRRALGRRSRRARPRRRRRAPHLPRDRPLGDRSRAAPVRASAIAPAAVARFQQLSAPIAAKAVEDTGFYRYGRLLSRNDVGFDPATFALDADAFHRRMQRAPGRLAARAAGHRHPRPQARRGRARAARGAERHGGRNGRPCSGTGSRPAGRSRATALLAPATSPCCCRRSSAPGPSISTPATLRAGAPSPSGWSPGSRRRCARPSSPATGPPSTRPMRRRRATSPSRWSPRRRCPTCCTRIAALVQRIAPGRRAQWPGAVPAAHDRAGRARSLPGRRALGPEPGRSRQSPAGRLAAPRSPARRPGRWSSWPPIGVTAGSSRP